jgi:hypothetical protein
MLPSATHNGVSRCHFANSERLTYCCVGQSVVVAKMPHLSNVVFGQLGLVGLFSDGHSPLLDRVKNVGRVSPWEKMRNPDASRVVAVVANEQSLGYGAVSQGVGIAVSTDHRLTVAGGESPIPCLRDSTRPQPARAKFEAMGGRRSVLVYLGPESKIGRGAQRLRIAPMSAKQPLVVTGAKGYATGAADDRRERSGRCVASRRAKLRRSVCSPENELIVALLADADRVGRLTVHSEPSFQGAGERAFTAPRSLCVQCTPAPSKKKGAA